tara:strand:- start:5042 stop:6097 length:1056 start_codon:yes stop_codon:yes gene_type:complete
MKSKNNYKMQYGISKIKRNLGRGLFEGPTNLIITISLSTILSIIISKIYSWIVFDADWSVVKNNLTLFAFGSYPQVYIWRPLIWLLIVISISLYTIMMPSKFLNKHIVATAWLFILPVGIFLLAGGFGLEEVHTNNWGGISLTLILTISSGLLALPFGVLLALGRQSNLKVLSNFCRLYIDIVRASPLITVLFFGQLLIPLFLPQGLEVSRVIRAILAFAIFAASYMAEDIRGGIQSIPKTQIEAAEALGLNKFECLILIILPQGFRVAIPSLTNQMIGLLQNTSLMAILGLVELLGITRSLLANPNYIGGYMEAYVWIGLIYWLSCTFISALFRKLENNLSYNINKSEAK